METAKVGAALRLCDFARAPNRSWQLAALNGQRKKSCFDLDCCHSRGREGRGARADAGGAVRARRWCAPAPRFNNCVEACFASWRDHRAKCCEVATILAERQQHRRYLVRKGRNPHRENCAPRQLHGYEFLSPQRTAAAARFITEASQTANQLVPLTTPHTGSPLGH
jgi:hypothetical protein